jgi:CDP-diacylglycerol--glycerol-3-phosphate 3-phosphatidyltransferase
MAIDWRDLKLIPNQLTLFRLLLLPLPAIMIAKGHDYVALGLLCVGIATDLLDGVLARRLNQISELGKLLDPIADKLGIAILVITLAIYRDFPIWAAALIIGRDLVILVAGIFFVSSTTYIPTSNMLGKLTALAWTLLVMSYLTPFAVVQQLLLYMAVVMVPLSFFSYIIKVMKERRRTSKAQE